MLCEKCGVNAAITHIRAVVNGVEKDVYLCKSCAANCYHAAHENPNSQLLAAILNGYDILTSTTLCALCGSSFDDIIKSGKCGCPQCYTTFYERLLPHIKKVQGNVEYVGKRIVLSDKNVSKSIDELNTILKKHIENENYEQAAIVRDEIKKLKEGAI